MIQDAGINVSGAVLQAQGRSCRGRWYTCRARRPREPARAASGPGRAPAPSSRGGRSSGARSCCILPTALGWGSPSWTTPATAEPPPLWDGVLGTDSSRHPRGTRSGALRRAALRTRGALRTPLLPGSEQSSNETEPTGMFPSLARSGAAQTRPRWVSEENPTAPGGSAPPHPLRCGTAPLAPREGPGPAALRVQPPGSALRTARERLHSIK